MISTAKISNSTALIHTCENVLFLYSPAGLAYGKKYGF